MTGRRDPVPFDVLGALPIGTTVLEASAGTGKTYTIAALAARYVAEGRVTLPELMLVTFGRDATQELRERVRERLVGAERGLADAAAARAGDDGLLRLLAGVPDTEVSCRRRRLTHALAHFDAATIATTHQFCQQMLAGLGIAADADPEATFVESIDDLLTEVVDDFYLRKYGGDGGTGGAPAFSRATALTIARAAVGDSQARLEPADAPAGSVAYVRRSFAVAVRAEVARRKLARRCYTYDDMVTRLAATLTDPGSGPGACARLQERYRVVLVDEFQDTDPMQWQILAHAFHGHTTLVLIGDPKQAIYAFRGADVVSYLDAAATAGTHATLARNHRSDAPLLAALHTVFGGAALGDDRIVVRPVGSVHPEQRLTDAPAGAPLRLRVLRHDQVPIPAGKKVAAVAPVRQIVARDLATDVAALLASPAQLADPGCGRRAVRPGDIAVLVRTNAQGGLVRDALAAAGVPGVLAGTASVFGTAVAAQWLTLLEAVEQPGRTARVRAAALTCFLGHTIAQLCGPGADELLDELATTLRRWAGLLHERGVAALLEAVTTAGGLPQRLLAQADGERCLTDVRHIGQALHRAAAHAHLGPAALADWLRQQIAQADTDTGTERSRRLESDADAVQILTVHRSKGCEFGIVYLPFGWDRHARDPEVALLHEDGNRLLDVGGPTGAGWQERCRRHRAEEAGEDLRLLYVALTRARCQVVTWWAPTTTTAASPVHRLLLGRPAPGEEVAPTYRVPPQNAALAALQALAGPDLAVEEWTERGPAPWRPAPGPAPLLRAAEFGRRLDTGWRRTSYSALTADAHPTLQPGTQTGSEPEETGTDDEAIVVPVLPVPDDLPGLDSPMAQLPIGAAFGTLVHAILEAADPTAPDLHAELHARAAEQLARQPVAGLDARRFATALAPVVRTPLGPLTGGRSLSAVSPADRLAELTFEFPLAGGDTDRRPPAVTIGHIAALLRRRLGADDPLGGYADALAEPELAGQPLRGYLTGSIDAVLRLPDQRYVVVDYKTNWLGPPATSGAPPLSSRYYTAPALAEAMTAAHYPLQALIYLVALHRYLRWRQPGYQPRRHLGGALYLFLRGMCGPDTPAVEGVPCGVFSWVPPAALVCELSALLDGGAG